MPLRLGGKTTWENIITACDPIRPTRWQLQQHGKSYPPGYLHETWRDWLHWDIELEE